ncbi:MAG: gamma-butyrobetaine hydroxylase-like domain-containing protein [Tepidisphaeraceae bacterium]
MGNYAIRLNWSDKHASGIYSFTYLREISPA